MNRIRIWLLSCALNTGARDLLDSVQADPLSLDDDSRREAREAVEAILAALAVERKQEAA